MPADALSNPRPLGGGPDITAHQVFRPVQYGWVPFIVVLAKTQSSVRFKSTDGLRRWWTLHDLYKIFRPYLCGKCPLDVHCGQG
jgi:hypothetical protein